MSKKLTKNLFMIIILVTLIGLVISLAQFLFHEIIELGTYMVNHNNITFSFMIITVLLLILLMTYINKRYKGYNGSGVPQFEAYFDHDREFNPILMLILITINTFIAFFTGFALGGEGPSITIAGSIGYYFNNLFKFKDKEYIMVACSTGFACAFIAPLAGFMHLIEENKKHLSWTLILKGILIIVPASFICYFVFNHNMLNLAVNLRLPYQAFYMLFIPILLSILVSYTFKGVVLGIKDLNIKYNFMIIGTIILGLIMILLKRYYPILTGGGGNFISNSYYDLSIILLLVLLVGRLLLTGLGTNSTLSGGIVIPMIAIGAIASDFGVSVFGLLDSNIYLYSDTLKLCTMLSVFALVTRCPLTAIVLGLRCGNVLDIILPLSIAVLVSYLLTDLIKDKSIYKYLAKRLTKSEVNTLGEV